MTTKTQNGKTKQRLYSPRKVALACGQRKTDGFFGVDISDCDGVDLVWDLFNWPWPIRDNAVEELECHHFVEHIPHWRPGWEKDGWWLFFDEVARICRKGASLQFIHPYCKADRAFWDPTHERYIHEATWYYLSREWREMQGLDHYPTDVNFEVVSVDGLGMSDALSVKHHEAQEFARNHYWNTVADLSIRLKALR